MEAKTKKILLVGSALLAVGLLVSVLILRGKRKKLEAEIKAGSADIVKPSSSTTTSALFPLKNGSGLKNTSENNAVKVVQRYLNAKILEDWYFGVTFLEEDGMFGPLTEAALYKLSGTKEVTFGFYKEMENYLAAIPVSLADKMIYKTS